MMKMKALAITHKGAEDFSASEIVELSNAKILESFNGFILFEIDNLENLKKLCFFGQSFFRILELIDDFTSNNIIEYLLKKNVKINSSFRVKCTRQGQHDFNSNDIEKKFGESLLKLNPNSNVDLNNPEKIIHVYILDNRCFICDDLSIYDLSKRDYKIFIHPASIKGTLAYLMLKIAEYKKGNVLVDPFCGSGTIPIEAALYSNKISPHHFSKNRFNFEIDVDKINIKNKNIYGYDFLLKNIIAARKNAKIAGIESSINFSKIEISWIDSKFEESEVDCIVTNPPKLSKHLLEKDFIKLMDEFFYQSKFVLNKKGVLVLLSNQKSMPIIEDCAKKHSFKKNLFLPIDIGSEDLNIVRFIKI